MKRWLAAALVLLLGACSSMPADRVQTLEGTLRAYERALRWNDFKRAEAFRQEPGATEPDYSGLRVTAYRVLSRNLNKAQDDATQTVQIEYYREDTAVQHQIEDPQHWVYDAASARWYLASPLPVFP